MSNPRCAFRLEEEVGMLFRMRGRALTHFLVATLATIFVASIATNSAHAQRAFGIDVSYWQSEITPAAWSYAYNTDDRVFAFVRSSRGGTTGLNSSSGTPSGNP